MEEKWRALTELVRSRPRDALAGLLSLLFFLAALAFLFWPIENPPASLAKEPPPNADSTATPKRATSKPPATTIAKASADGTLRNPFTFEHETREEAAQAPKTDPKDNRATASDAATPNASSPNEKPAATAQPNDRANPPSAANALRLTGIAKSDVMATATIETGTGTSLVTVGDQVAGYAVTAIEDGAVHLTQENFELILRLPGY